MKKLSVLILLFVGVSVIGFAQNDAINRFFENYIEDERFTSVYVSPKLIEIVSQIDFEALDEGDLSKEEAAMIEEVLDQLNGLMVLKTEETPEKFYKEALSSISGRLNEFDLLLSVRDKGTNVRMWTTTAGETINELLLLVGGEDEFVMLSLMGNIDLKKISKLAGNINVEGIEYLEHLEKEQ